MVLIDWFTAATAYTINISRDQIFLKAKLGDKDTGS